MGGRRRAAAGVAAVALVSLWLGGPRLAAATTPATTASTPATTASTPTTTTAAPTTTTTLPPGVGVPVRRGPGLPLAARILLVTAVGLVVAAAAWRLGSRKGGGRAPPG